MLIPSYVFLALFLLHTLQIYFIKRIAIYNKLFQDYKNVYRSLEKAYRQANSARFEGTDQE